MKQIKGLRIYWVYHLNPNSLFSTEWDITWDLESLEDIE
jgi:hypothetical protein